MFLLHLISESFIVVQQIIIEVSFNWLKLEARSHVTKAGGRESVPSPAKPAATLCKAYSKSNGGSCVGCKIQNEKSVSGISDTGRASHQNVTAYVLLSDACV